MRRTRFSREAWRRPAALVGLALLAMACTTERARFKPLAVGDAAPAYAATSLDGDSVSIGSLKGNVVLLNIWATWCVPCRREMPVLDSLSQVFADRGVRVIGVSVDDGGSDERVHEFVQEHGITFTIWRDPDARVSGVFNTRGVPETFLIDREGRIAKHWMGGVDAPHVKLFETVARLAGAGGTLAGVSPPARPAR